jgi:hypothetical protein
LVNDDDVTIIGATYAPGVLNASWAMGDFDYNRFVDDDDVTLLGAFYQRTAAAPPPVRGGGVSGEGLAKDEVQITRRGGQAADEIGPGTAGPPLPAAKYEVQRTMDGIGARFAAGETFGLGLVRGRETLAQQEIRAQHETRSQKVKALTFPTVRGRSTETA